MALNILLVEDEHDLGNVVKQYLEINGFIVTWCLTGVQAQDRLLVSRNAFDLLLIDVSMPGMDGFELAAKINELQQRTPFLFLTARNERGDRLRGLKLGADDYIVKPFDIDELVLRIKNIVRRNQSAAVEPTGRPFLVKGDVRLYRSALTISIGGSEEVTLTSREAQLLEYLFHHENVVIKREDVLSELWGESDYFLGRSLDVFISRLRKHLSPSTSVSINNIYGVGFMFSVKR
jgi:DNA-binding response OmpR family regulator